jgi:FixJ family two-component response regulator
MTADAVVYVVDDDESVRRSLARLVRWAGLEVETFPSASAFLERKVSHGPSCLVLDIRLPGRSGLELQDVLGEAQRTMPIIFITGHGTVPTSVDAMKKGAVDFLLKPFNNRELLEAIQRALARSRAELVENAERAGIQRRIESLTPREREVLGLVVTGIPNKQIAASLGAAERTIKIHRARVMSKMQARSVAELVRMTQRVTSGFPIGAIHKVIGLD